MISISNKFKAFKTISEKKRFGLMLFNLGLLVLLFSCNQTEAPNEASDYTSANPDNSVILTQEQAALAGLEFGKIERKLLSGDVDARGKLLLPNDGKASISPVMGGVVTSIEVLPGQAVNKGQVLAYLTHPDYIGIQEQYLSAANTLEFLENDYNRQKRLYDENVSSEKKYLQAKTDYLGTTAKLNSLKLIIEQLGLDPAEIKKGNIYSRIPVRTPIDGMVNAIVINLGQNVAEGDELFEITCRKKLFVELDVFEKDVMKIKKGQRVTFKLSNVDDRNYEATIIAIGGAVQRDGRVVKVLAEFKNTSEFLFPGMFVASEIHTGEEVFDALPESAIMNFGTGNPYIYYTTSAPNSPKLSFLKTAVKTGFDEHGFVQVQLMQVLPEGAMIVTNGGYYVQSEESGDE